MKKIILDKEFTIEDISSLGVKDLAFTPEEADKFLDYLKDKNILILGGDIIIINHDKLEFAHDNWYSESSDALETYNTAKIFLNECKKSYRNQNYLVAIVF